jgi:glucose-1-phosphate adenylyltransferase
VLVLVLAGGAGLRLRPLTLHRPKPAVAFGGRGRLIDIVLSNLRNSSHDWPVLVLAGPHRTSLEAYLARVWGAGSGIRVSVWAGPRGRGFVGTADAVFQSLDFISRWAPEVVLVFAADHVYEMDVSEMVAEHRRSGAGVTVASCRVDLDAAARLGVMVTREDGSIKDWEEKPNQPTPLPADPVAALASMGNYAFEPGLLARALVADAASTTSSHDFGRDVIPALVAAGEATAYDFSGNRGPGAATADYWRDVGTLDAYYQASFEWVDPARHPGNATWPMPGAQGRSLADGGSVIFPGARVASTARLYRSIVLPGATVGPEVVLERSIVDEGAEVPAGTVAVDGVGMEQRPVGWVSPGGIRVLTSPGDLPGPVVHMCRAAW